MFARDESSRTSAEEFVERLKELVAANIAGNVQLASRFTELVRDAAQAARASRAGAAPTAGQLLSRWLDFNLASYSAVSAHGLALLNALLSAAESTLIPRPASAGLAGAAAEPRVELRLEGRPGDRVMSAFLVENRFERPLDVTFESEDLVPATGATLPASLVAFEPATLSIGPRGQAVVQTAVTITRDFVVGQTYVTTIRVLGLQAKEVGLSVTVRPPASETTPAGPRPDRTEAADAQRER